MDKASEPPRNPVLPPAGVTEICKGCTGFSYMTAYMVAKDLEPGCIGVKTTLKRGSPHEQAEPEARLEPNETYVLGYSVANRHKNGAWSSPNVLFGVSVKNVVHTVPTKERNYDEFANKIMNFYVTSLTDLAKKICTPEFPIKVYRSSCDIYTSASKVGTRYVSDLKKAIEYIFR